MLYYCETEQGNFGDDLNPWLIPRLAPELCDPANPTLFVGIGTILSHRLPAGPMKRVWGAGWSGTHRFKIDGSWKIYCVRGPLTAAGLGLPTSLAVTDPAILARRFAKPAARKLFPVSFMPHHQSMPKADWPALCGRIGIHCIDPRHDVERVLDELGQTELLLAEAMHGAIVADALRVPWIPVRMYGRFTLFKWEDWTRSIEVPLRIADIPAVCQQTPSFSKRLNYRIKKGLASAGLGKDNWKRLETRASSPQEIDETLRSLQLLPREQAGCLSSETILRARETELLEHLARLQADWKTSHG